MELKDFKRDVFNTDPKHETERQIFDTMVEDSVSRITERKIKENPPKKEDENLFDALVSSIFGSKK